MALHHIFPLPPINQVDGLRAELQRVIKQRDVQMEKAEADAKVLHDQVRRGYLLTLHQ
jgi:hypothetical protein